MNRWVHRPEGSNWGDFGEDDQIGRMNYLTPERRRSGLAEALQLLAGRLGMFRDAVDDLANPVRDLMQRHEGHPGGNELGTETAE